MIRDKFTVSKGGGMYFFVKLSGPMSGKTSAQFNQLYHEIYNEFHDAPVMCNDIELLLSSIRNIAAENHKLAPRCKEVVIDIYHPRIPGIDYQIMIDGKQVLDIVHPRAHLFGSNPSPVPMYENDYAENWLTKVRKGGRI